jgi:non-specific serine/threonine protein kinase
MEAGKMRGSESVDLAATLRRWRLGAGMTQEALAERSGLGLRSIQGLERGETRPRRETIRRLTEALHLSAEQAGAFERSAQPGPRRHLGASRESVGAQSGGGTRPRARHNLPVQLTSFVGRERELAELGERLTSTRLLTLTGTGGCGKTRLGLRVAAEAIDAYADGVWLVELAALADPGLVAHAVARALGVREVGGEPIRATLLAVLRPSRLLLVLDNCEHLLVACARLADATLRACPGVRILATSREALGIDGEVAWRVPSLAVAPPEAVPRPDRLLAYAAVRLFVERAGAAEPTFALTAENAPAVARICRRLDGIPLAIELAARRVVALSVGEIAARLDQRFRLLAHGSPAAPPRQQTLAATVDWSYHLLTPLEQALFDRLGVFAGGFDAEAAEAVCGTSAVTARGSVEEASADGSRAEGILTRVPTEDVLDLLTRLVEKSLVTAEVGPAGGARYRLLETLRQYARERLAARGELDAIADRHAAYYVGSAEEANRHLQGPDQLIWLDRLERDHDNLRAALRRVIERADVALAMRLAASLSYFWYFRGHFSESRALRAAVLALPAGPEHAPLRAELLQGIGMLALRQGDYPAARAYLDEGAGIARRVGDPRLLAPTLATLGFVARVQDDYAACRPALEEALTVARELGDTFHTAMALHHLGLLALEADRQVEPAWALNEQSLALYRQIGNRRMAGVVLGNMGRVARARGDPAGARALLVETVRALREIGDLGPMPQMLYTLAAVEADEGRLGRAVRLQAAATTMEDAVGTRVWPANRRERDAWLGRARAALGEAGFARHWAEGQAMTTEQAVDDAQGADQS